jgi:hypothetical protein
MRKLFIAVASVAIVSATAIAATAQGHPRLDAAITALTAARAELVAAPNDFGGHKADAIKAIDNATRQLNLALKFANK